jgi:hypothetical protein
MYLRETKRRNADGSEVSYLALAHNERDPESGVPRAQIVHRFGRADEVDREALRRLVKSISRFLDPADAVAATVSGEVSVVESRALGACWVADRLWQRLGIDRAIIAAVGGRRLDAEAVERTLFAMVANRLSVKPLSKLAGCGWVELTRSRGHRIACAISASRKDGVHASNPSRLPVGVPPPSGRARAPGRAADPGGRA